MSGFRKDYSHTNLYKKYSNRINTLAKQINKETRNVKYDDKIRYLYSPPLMESKIWKEYMSRAERIISRNRSGTGIAVLRVFFEDENLENPSVRTGGENPYYGGIFIFSPDGGFSGTRGIQNGDAVYVGSSFWRYGMAEPNDKDASVSGNVMIGGIYHYPIMLKVEVQKGKVVAFGDVIVRTVPQEYRGNLMVKVKAEDDLKLNDADVSLKVYGFYSGITRPVKEDSCLFDSIGPGKYSVEMATNNFFASPVKSAEVVSGKTAEVTINAYRHRLIELDWRFRRANEPNWSSGRTTIKTREYWQPDNEWPDVRYPVIQLGDWINNSCQINASNGDLMYVGNNEPFEEMEFPSAFVSSSYKGFPVKQGDIFAWRSRDDPKRGLLEALIRIRKITLIGLPDE
jgi:predicted RecA/RadA family phage recombinase